MDAAYATPRMSPVPDRDPLLAIVGSPNVGKSVLFNNFTGRYVTVSNYPGTTVEISSGEAKLQGRRFEVIDTPGMYSLVPISGEELVTRQLLMDRQPDVVLHVVDAKNLDRMLPLTLQLLELGLPVVLALNMFDEAEKLGVRIDVAGLSRELGIPVLPTVATSRRGMDEVIAAVVTRAGSKAPTHAEVRYPEAIDAAARKIASGLPDVHQPRARGLSLLLLQGERDLELGIESYPAVKAADEAAKQGPSKEKLSYALAIARHERARELLGRHLRIEAAKHRSFAERLSELTITPWTGIPILATVLYFGLYQFVGVFGAGTVVDFLENTIFGTWIVGPLNGFLERVLPGVDGWRYWARELVGGDYGIITLGATYAFAIVLPIVSLFFLFFSMMEDSGYFPRLAMLVDRVFKRIGLNGRAVIPIVLGFGCVTMATMVTRIQETKRERLLTTLLLAMAIPCSAQYGVITALLASQAAGVLGVSYAFLIWAGIMSVIFLTTGLVASKLLEGEAASFYMELPPLRMPRLGNVVLKTLARMKWYFYEVLPIFILASVLIWVGRITGGFDLILRALEPLIGLLGLPAAAAPSFLYGFFRRDFGAAGLYALYENGGLTGVQTLVACVTLTLFLPCVAQLLIMKKERGLKATVLMSAGVLTTAFVVGGLVNAVLTRVGFGS